MFGALLLAALPILALPIVASAADLRIDHVTVAGRDLKALRSALSAAGIPSEYGGAHANHATEMALTSFTDGSYLELIALQPQADPVAVAHHDWSAQIRGEAGPTAWAVRVADLDLERRRLQAAHIHVTEPEKSGRARPDGVELRWETAQIGAASADAAQEMASRGTFFPFLIRDLTPRDQRVFASGKPTAPAFRGISRIVIAAKNLPSAIAQFETAYGWRAPVMQDDAAFGAHLAIFQGTPVVLAAPIGASSWIADRLQRFGEGPCAYVLGVQGTLALKTASQTKWAGVDISWVDNKLLGWHLGIEP
jgi:hypothetical protein